jgi:hypothetical protein
MPPAPGRTQTLRENMEKRRQPWLCWGATFLALALLTAGCDRDGVMGFKPGGDFSLDVKDLRFAGTGAAGGYVDEFKVTPEGIKVSGWAADLTAKKPADAVILLNEKQELFWSNTIGTIRPDVVNAIKSAPGLRFGYEFLIPIDFILTNKPTELYVYAYLAASKQVLPLDKSFKVTIQGQNIKVMLR